MVLAVDVACTSPVSAEGKPIVITCSHNSSHTSALAIGRSRIEHTEIPFQDPSTISSMFVNPAFDDDFREDFKEQIEKSYRVYTNFREDVRLRRCRKKQQYRGVGDQDILIIIDEAFRSS